MALDFASNLKFQQSNPYLLRLLEEGTATTPIQSHWQGAARLANALLGGLEQGRLRGEDESARQQRMNLPGLEDSSMPAAARPTMGTSPPSIDQITTGAAVNAATPASIRYNNPGAQYPGQSATAYGSTGAQTIGGGHKIAQFNSPEEGAAAQFDLLDKKYGGMKVSDALAKWSGGNNVGAYVQNVAKAGISPETVITPEFLRSPKGIQLAQAMAQHEAGRPYPMTPEQWQTAQARAYTNPAGQPADTRQQVQRSPVEIPPQVAQQIKAMLGSRDPLLQQQGMAMYQQYAKPREETRPLTNPQERARYGIQATDTNPYQVDAKGEVKAINPQPFAVNVNQQAESEFSKEAAKSQVKRYEGHIEDLPAAKQMLSDVDTLRTLGTKIGTGKEAEIKGALGPYANLLGIKIEGLGEIQAYEAIVNRMAPQLRVKGTGAQSDFELRNFMKSLPTVGSTPEGNEMTTRVLEGLYNNKAKAAEISSRAINGEISRSEADKMLRELPDPMKEYREFIKKNPTSQSGGSGIRQFNPATGKIE